MTITELEKAVTQSSEKDFARFREWFEEYEWTLPCAGHPNLKPRK